MRNVSRVKVVAGLPARDREPALHLLAAKITPPKLPARAIERGRVSALLDVGMQGPVVTVCSPTGFGKTTAVAGWCQRHEPDTRIAWISLDRADNEIPRFAAYFVSALARAGAKVPDAVMDAAQAGSVTDLEALLTQTLAGINSTAAPSRRIVIVLDDYHYIENPVIHESLKLFLRHMPAHMTAVFISRTEPDIGLPYLRASAQVFQVDEQTLGFDEEEALEFFRKRLDFPVSRELVRRTLTRLEGWAAGLQLMTLSVRDAEDFRDAAEQFTGRDRHVFDYLADDVLARLPEAMRRFLLFTGILDRFDAGIAARVTGIPDSRRLLLQLEHDHLFIFPLDRDRNWYRYHQLFSDFLRNQLEIEYPGHAPGLHRIASDAWLARGCYEEAARHALAAADTDRIVTVLERGGRGFYEQGKIALLNRCLDALPHERLTTSGPAALLSACRALNLERDLEVIEPLLSEAGDRLPGLIREPEWQRYNAAFSALRALNGALALADDTRVEQWARHALDHLPPDDTSMRA